VKTDVDLVLVISILLSIVISLYAWQYAFMLLFFVFLLRYKDADLLSVLGVLFLFYLRMIFFEGYLTYGDILNRYNDYLWVYSGNNVFSNPNFEPGEYASIMMNYLLVFLFGKIGFEQYAVIWYVLIVVGLMMLIVKMSKFAPVYAFGYLIFFDIGMAYHLGWQCLSTFVLMLYIIDYWYSDKKFVVKKFIAYMAISSIIHSSAVIFFPVTLIVVKFLSVKFLKGYVLVCFILGYLIIDMDLVRELIRQTHGIPILSKLYFAVLAEEKINIEGGFRVQFLFSLMVSFILKSNDMLFRVYLFYSGLFLLLMQIPIIDVRVGYISYSFLVGIPYALYAMQIRNQLLLRI